MLVVKGEESGWGLQEVEEEDGVEERRVGEKVVLVAIEDIEGELVLGGGEMGAEVGEEVVLVADEVSGEE